MSGLNCRPGDLARIVGLPPQMAEANDRIVRLKNQPPGVSPKGSPEWALEAPVEFVLLGNGRRGRVRFYIGESVYFDTLQDEYLRPIRDSDGEDEMLRIAGKPERRDAKREVERDARLKESA